MNLASLTDYHFVIHWRVLGTRDDVASILKDPVSLPQWWPSAFLEVHLVEAGDSSGVGQVTDLVAKGWLPYRLRWRFTMTDPPTPDGFALDATGDLVGRGLWSYTQDAEFVNVSYDWRICVAKPLVRRLSWLLRPVFAANHSWFMARVRESLVLEIARRRIADPVALVAIPPPPAPTFVRKRRRTTPG